MKKIILTRDGHLGKSGRKFNFPDERADYLVRIGAAKYFIQLGAAADEEKQPYEPKQAVVKRTYKKKKK